MSSAPMMQERCEPVKAAPRSAHDCPHCGRNRLRAMQCVGGLIHCVECGVPVSPQWDTCPACEEECRWRCHNECAERVRLVQRPAYVGNRLVNVVMCLDCEREHDWAESFDLERERAAELDVDDGLIARYHGGAW